MTIAKPHLTPTRPIGVALFLLVGCIPLAAPAAETRPSSGAAQASQVSDEALRAAATDESTRRFYELNGWERVWSASAARALEQILTDRSAHGLDRLSFLADAETSPSVPSAASSSASSSQAAVSAAKEVALTGAALRYATALSQGTVDPADLHEVYTLARPEVDVTGALAGAIAQGKLATWFAGLAPQDDDYAKLSDGYRAAAKAAKQSAEPADADIATSGLLRVGDSDDRVAGIVAQLSDAGYFGGGGAAPAAVAGSASPSAPASPSAADASDRYTQEIADAVERLQADYGIATDGVIGPDTLEVLNFRPADRARSLAVALERRRWQARDVPATRIDVNIAASSLRYYRDGSLVDQRKVIVGKPGNETPLLLSPIYRLVANPTWTVPKSIENSEMANVGASYLKSRNMVRRDGYIVQQPGPDNALGLVKFDMQNEHAIYLHDTNAPSLFDRSQRHLSHGCVRVADALGFARMIAQDQGIAEEWQAAHGGSDMKFVDLPNQLPVRLLYQNVFVDDRSEIAFRTDPYAWNAPIAKALGFGEGSTRRARAEAVDVSP